MPAQANFHQFSSSAPHRSEATQNSSFRRPFTMPSAKVAIVAGVVGIVALPILASLAVIVAAGYAVVHAIKAAGAILQGQKEQASAALQNSLKGVVTLLFCKMATIVTPGISLVAAVGYILATEVHPQDSEARVWKSSVKRFFS